MPVKDDTSKKTKLTKRPISEFIGLFEGKIWMSDDFDDFDAPLEELFNLSAGRENITETPVPASLATDSLSMTAQSTSDHRSWPQSRPPTEPKNHTPT